MRLRIISILAIILILPLLLSGCGLSNSTAQKAQEPVVTLEQYEDAFGKYCEINMDMSYNEVAKIIGSPGEIVATGESEPASTSSITPAPAVPNLYIWRINIDGQLRISVAFNARNGGVSDKKFTCNLAFVAKENARTTDTEFQKVEKGMTYEQVVSILGSPGICSLGWETHSNTQIHYNGIHVYEYAWWSDTENKPSYGNGMNVRFKDGAVDSLR
jgi:hypothetical protein